eukprot:GFYU01011477.1.p1 GENE.GFYU01011477.1~~GFYU01011477.1.p1  ORF type:complete len:353 (-),score=94.80 GFYU01011477.1:268-1326(-)
MTATKIPETMKAVVVNRAVKDFRDVESLKQDLTVKEIPVPKPKKGQVLIKVMRSAINPSDTSFLQGNYGTPLEIGGGAGFEGCGLVVASGGGFMAWRLTGKRVVFGGASGIWAEYAVVNAMSCMEMPSNAKWEDAACAVVNPLTAIAFVRIAQAGGHKSIIHSAGASNLGQMLIRHCVRLGIECICTVRKEASAQKCRELGAKHVVITADEGSDKKLQEICKELGTKLAFDSVGGDTTKMLLSALCPGGEVQIYGVLSGKNPDVPAKDLIFMDKVFRGFWLVKYMKQGGLFNMLGMVGTMQKYLLTDFKTTIVKTVSLNDPAQAVFETVKHRDDGKVLLDCDFSDAGSSSRA